MNGKEGITEFVRVRYNLPLQKDAEVFEKDTEVLKKDTELFKKHQGLFASFSTGCLFLNVHVGIGLHVYIWGIERSGFFNGREKWVKGFENQMV